MHSRFKRLVAQSRNVALDIRYTGRPLRDLRRVTSDDYVVSAPHAIDYRLIDTAFQFLFAGAEPGSEDVFVDIGCGYGRVLVVAHRRYPTMRIVGLEGEPGAAGRAKRGVGRRYPDISITQGWAPEAIPSGASYVYVWSAIPGETMVEILKALTVSSAPSLRVVVCDPPGEGLMTSSSEVRRQFNVETHVVSGKGLLHGKDFRFVTFVRRVAEEVSPGL